MFRTSYTKGFTLIEMLIVLALMAMLLTLSAPFVTSLRSDIAMKRVLRSVKLDMVSTISYSLAGKSFSALDADDLTDPALIPSAYALYFEKDFDYGDTNFYEYLEFVSEEDGTNKPMTVSYKNPHEYPAPSVYLHSIVFRESVTGNEVDADAGYIIVLPPFGKLLFVRDDESFLKSLTEDDLYINQHDFDEIILGFQYKDKPQTKVSLSLNRNKVINVQ